LQFRAKPKITLSQTDNALDNDTVTSNTGRTVAYDDWPEELKMRAGSTVDATSVVCAVPLTIEKALEKGVYDVKVLPTFESTLNKDQFVDGGAFLFSFLVI